MRVLDVLGAWSGLWPADVRVDDEQLNRWVVVPVALDQEGPPHGEDVDDQHDEAHAQPLGAVAVALVDLEKYFTQKILGVAVRNECTVHGNNTAITGGRNSDNDVS